MRGQLPVTSDKAKHRGGESSLLRLSFALVLTLGIGSPLAAGEIVTYVSGNGQRVYVNSGDQESRLAAKHSGVRAAQAVLERRRRVLEIESYIDAVAREQEVDPSLVRAVIEAESAWNPRARSRKGALGLMQLMPETAVRLDVHDPLDPRENIRAGVRYLRSLLGRFHQDLGLALAAYNAGENALATRHEIPPYPETQAYVARVIPLYRKLQGAGARKPNRIERIAENGLVVFTNLN